MAHRVWIPLGFFALLAVGCPGPKALTPVGHTKAGVPDEVPWAGEGLKLSDADDDSNAVPTRAGDAKPLSTQETQAILARLPKLQGEAGDETAFALRAKSLPPPRTGKTIDEPFPPKPGPDAPQVSSSNLHVDRHAPEGDVPMVPNVSLTFSAPMVAVTSHDDVAKTKPASLTPEPPGRWEWLGTQTLVYKPIDRMPMATDYTVTVPQGTKSATGASLAEPVSWKFSTPAVTVKRSQPQGQTSLEPLMFVEFDQAIDPNGVLATTELKGSAVTPIRLATDEEIKRDSAINEQVKNVKARQWIAFRAVDKLQADTNYNVHFKAGTPSAEGPKKTTTDQTFSFRTRGEFALRKAQCGYSAPKCTPGTMLSLEFSNPIDAEKFDPALVNTSPAIDNMKVVASGTQIHINGNTKGRTTYAITVGQALVDTYGQTLARAVSESIKIESADPTLMRDHRNELILDPAAKGTFPLHSVNLSKFRVRLYSVNATRDDVDQFAKFRNYYHNDVDKRPSPPGKLISDTQVSPKKSEDEIVETLIDLAPALKNGVGQVLLIAENPSAPKERYGVKEEVCVWIQVTHLGLTTILDPDKALAWTTSLDSGAPVADVDVGFDGEPHGKTNAEGIARIARNVVGFIVASKGDDSVFAHYVGFMSRPTHEDLRFLMVTGRSLYKPGEDVQYKGWVRRSEHGQKGDLLPPEEWVGKSLNYKAYDGRHSEISKGEMQIGPAGSFDFAFKIPSNANLGQASVQFFRGAESVYTTSIKIDEYRRPEFEMTSSVSEGPHVVGKKAVVTAAAKYFAGGGLPNTDVNWSVSMNETSFTPPNRSDFTFGPQNDFGHFSYEYDGEGMFGGYGHRGSHKAARAKTWKGRTGPNGEHKLRVDFGAVETAFPQSIAVSASIQDVNRQAWTTNTSMLLHPSELYVGLRSKKGFVREGEPIIMDVIAVNLAGEAVADRSIELKSVRLDWQQKGHSYKEIELDPQVCTIKSGKDAVSCSLPTSRGGQHRITAIVTDEKGRKNKTQLRYWVTGGTPDSRNVDADKVKLVADKKEYRAGDTAEVLVIAPFFPAEGVLTLAREGFIETRRFTMKSAAEPLAVSIDGAFMPNLHARVDLVGKKARLNAQGLPDPSLPMQPAFANGEVNLVIPPLLRELKVIATPRSAKVDPGAKALIDISVNDASGVPIANADGVLIMVDEALLALSPYALPKPMDVFYRQRGALISASEVRRSLVLAKGIGALKGDDIGDAFTHGELGLSGFGGLGAGTDRKGTPLSSPSPSPKAAASGRYFGSESDDAPHKPTNGASIAVRSDFSAVAAFMPHITTDARGHAEASVKIPDNLTRYRIMVVMSDTTTRFGSGENTITARLPLMVRPSPPRFLNFGDTFDLSIVIQNQTDKPLDVQLAARAVNASLIDPRGRATTVPANDRVEVRLPARAEKAGTARFQIGAAAGSYADASQINFPVWTPATTEAFATYGTIDSGAVVQPVAMPTNVVKEYGSLDISTSSTALQSLTDAVLYLVKYPYECNEQRASRILAIASLRDVLSAFKAEEMPTPAAMIESVDHDLKQLKIKQQPDGGWGFWREESWPYLSVHVAHAISRAKEKGFTVDAGMMNRAGTYLAAIESHFDATYSPEARRAITAYALYVQKQMGKPNAGKAKTLIREAGGVDKAPLEALGWLLPTLADDKAPEVASILTRLQNSVSETAGAAHFTTSYSESNHLLLHSDRRTDGVLLEALIHADPKSTVIPKLVTGLLGHRKAGHWSNTQENAFVLIALDRYFNTYEKATPDFVARAWLGNDFVSEHAYRGRSTDRDQVSIPLSFLAKKDGEQNLTLAKDGPGRMYFRIGMNYAPSNLTPPPVDHGFTIARRYEFVDKAEDVKQDDAGVWHVRAGSRVRVRLQMVAPARRYHVALVDPLPAGFEALNSSLGGTEAIPVDPNAPKDRAGRHSWWRWSWRWYEHENMRDERVEAFASLLWDGVHEYVYVARATTLGHFVVPPTKAEEMYAPETFGRGKGDRVFVE